MKVVRYRSRSNRLVNSIRIIREPERCKKSDDENRFLGIEVMSFQLKLDFFDQLGDVSVNQFTVFRRFILKLISSVVKRLCVDFFRRLEFVKPRFNPFLFSRFLRLGL